MGSFETLKGTSFIKIFSISLIRDLTNNVKKDLKEGFELTDRNFPNPASMMLLRASEGIIKNYYKKTTGKNPNKKLENLIDDLTENYNVKKSLTGYLHFIRDKRNKAHIVDNVSPKKNVSQFYFE